MLAPQTLRLGDVKVGTLSLAESWLEEACADGDEVAARCRATLGGTAEATACEGSNISFIGLTPIGDLVEVVKARLTEAGLPQTQRSVEGQSWRQGAVVS